MDVTEWSDEHTKAFDEAVKKWIDVNGRIPTLEEESTIWESLAFPQEPTKETDLS